MSLVRRAFTVSAWTLLSRILGLVRDRLWAGALGGSLALDAFLNAFALPNLLRNLFGEGALTSAFIPRYVQMRAQDAEASERFAGAVLARLTIGLSVLCVISTAIAAAIVYHARGHLLSVQMMKIVMVTAMVIPQLPYCVFICSSAVLSGMLNGRRHFWAPAAAPVVLNLVMISTVWMSTENEAWIMPLAVLVAGILQLSLLVWALRRCGGMPPLVFATSPALSELRRAILPSLVATGIYQVNACVDQFIAQLLIDGTGAVSYLYFGNRLLQFPLALIGHGVTTVAYPELARRVGEGWGATGEGIRAAARLQAYWLLPAAVGLLATSEPLVRAIYQNGSFSAEGVERTVMVVRFLALSLVPISLSKLFVRAFHAHRDQTTPMRVSMLMVGLNLVLNLVLVLSPWTRGLRESALALATASSSLVGCCCYLALLRRRGAGAVLPLLGLLRPSVGALCMGAGVVVLLHAWPQGAHHRHASLHASLRLGCAVALGMGIYLPIAGLSWLRRSAQTAPGNATAPGSSDPTGGSGDNLTM
jgi:putative peptidoglycan lipid II flippase